MFDLSSTAIIFECDADLLDRLVFHVVSNERIVSVTTIEELGLNAAFEDKLNGTERVFSFASYDVLDLHRPLIILTV